MAQFYTLEEAARVLGMNPEDLKVKAQQREVRAFMDSGSWRFRVADIDELARRRGLGSDPDLSLSEFEQDSVTGSDFDISQYQLGVANDGSDIAKSPAAPAQPASDAGSGQQDILADDLKLPPDPLTSSSSTIIGMEPSGKHPSDSDVRLVPESGLGRAASDSDVRLASGPIGQGTGFKQGSSSSDSDVTFSPSSRTEAEAEPKPSGSAGDSDVSIASDADLRAIQGDSSDDMIPVVDPGATMMRPSPLPSLGSSAELETTEGEEPSDFELSPSNLIDALQPESGSDFELTALDPSDEFESTPPLRPSDSDVTGASPVASGINLARPSDSGINLQAPGGFDLSQSDSIELMPLEGEEAPPPKSAPTPVKEKPDLAATALPTKKVDLSATALPTKKVDLSATALPTKKVDLSATALPTKKADLSATSLPVKKDKDIFEDTDFEVDALDASSDDRTVQLDASSDFEIDESDSRTDIFALDEDDVDKNAATALAPALPEGSDSSGDMPASSESMPSSAVSDEMDASWDLGEAASTPSGPMMPAAASSAPALAPSPLLASAAPAAEWGGLWVGMVVLSTIVVMITAFVTMDLVNNLYEYRGSTASSGLVKSIASLFPGGK